ncbi:MAG TPA: hypothetical protein VGN34_11085, partial [Ktedonobacteraceae bacterium]
QAYNALALLQGPLRQLKRLLISHYFPLFPAKSYWCKIAPVQEINLCALHVRIAPSLTRRIHQYRQKNHRPPE